MQENIMIRRYPLYFVATLAYAVFYTICLYHNGSGIMYPLFTAGTLVYFVVCLQQADIHRKKNSIWYFAAIELLGVSNCLTGDERILFFNKLGIFLLLLCFCTLCIMTANGISQNIVEQLSQRWFYHYPVLCDR